MSSDLRSELLNLFLQQLVAHGVVLLAILSAAFLFFEFAYRKSDDKNASEYRTERHFLSWIISTILLAVGFYTAGRFLVYGAFVNATIVTDFVTPAPHACQNFASNFTTYYCEIVHSNLDLGTLGKLPNQFLGLLKSAGFFASLFSGAVLSQLIAQTFDERSEWWNPVNAIVDYVLLAGVWWSLAYLPVVFSDMLLPSSNYGIWILLSVVAFYGFFFDKGRKLFGWSRVVKVYVDAKIENRHEPDLPKRTLVAYLSENSLQNIKEVQASETDDAELQAILFAIQDLKGKLKRFMIICDHESVVTQINQGPDYSGHKKPLYDSIWSELDKANHAIAVGLLKSNPAHRVLNAYLREEKNRGPQK